MARVYPFNNGVLMLRNISAPFLNALEDNPWWTLRGCCPENCWPFTGGKNGFCHFHSFHVHKKNKTRILEPIGEKKAPRNWTQQHIYIYIACGDKRSAPLEKATAQSRRVRTWSTTTRDRNLQFWGAGSTEFCEISSPRVKVRCFPLISVKIVPFPGNSTFTLR